MPITTSGVGSGINIRELVDELMAAESKDKKLRFDRNEAEALTKITAYGTLKGALSDLKDKVNSLKESNPFASRLVNSGLTTDKRTVLEAKATNTAQTGDFQIEIIALAKAHKLSSANFANSTTIVGTGMIEFQVGATTYSVEITDQDKTLQGIKNKINEVSKTTGITASLITSDSGAVLTFQADKTGLDNAFIVTVVDNDSNDTDNNGLSKLASNHLTIAQAAQNATVKIDGVTVTSETNTLTDAIEGVTLDLLGTNTLDPITMKVSLDKDAAGKAIEDFVNAYNNTLDAIKKLTAFNKEDPKNAGILIGDALTRNAQTQLRRILNTANYDLPLAVSSLTQMGISTDRITGKLEIDPYKLNSVITKNYDEIGQFFIDNENGLFNNLESTIDTYIKNDGVIKSKTNGLNKSIDLITEQRVNLERHLIHFEERLLSQFIAMDSIVANLRSTSDFLKTQLDSLAEPLSFRK
ncbi:flagellar filament capping protein FliD [Candidatus Berkiella aquae]|uniref:Flagellar hook-associated protein 2 n=1 Tax=Candidatus Berkiella aquae TaxID=295108 RepID=A0A0Q9YLH8_9GAMM|nr:flagellar filament capping protein FliD [Candidatus Berkiella aquae]MCS5711435.1 flagellar filament capping protein FliD [Candidatus Berkiella aquae]